ncbi:uncharacterized protein IWZ02DRAFT_429171 [Phyllosticta citriasiana]|uniref:uncharacterized protein n=1 Tax=Phyllosticta citriasiana TaxID=595635 RepID=UPI0030FDBEF0
MSSHEGHSARGVDHDRRHQPQRHASLLKHQVTDTSHQGNGTRRKSLSFGLTPPPSIRDCDNQAHKAERHAQPQDRPAIEDSDDISGFIMLSEHTLSAHCSPNVLSLLSFIRFRNCQLTVGLASDRSPHAVTQILVKELLMDTLQQDTDIMIIRRFCSDNSPWNRNQLALPRVDGSSSQRGFLCIGCRKPKPALHYHLLIRTPRNRRQC